MEDIKRILAVSWITQYCKETVHYAVSLASKYDAELDIKTIVKEGEPVEEILKMVKKEKIDLLVLRANEESRIEHFLVGGSNDELIRMMPCSIFLVKNEPKSRVGRIKK